MAASLGNSKICLEVCRTSDAAVGVACRAGRVKVPLQLWRAENDLLVPHPRYAEAVRLAPPQAPDAFRTPDISDFLVPCTEGRSGS